jgi:integrase
MIQCFERYLSHWKKRKLNSLTKSDVQVLVNKLGSERGCTTANRTLQLLRAVINKMKSWDFFAGANPAEGISKFKEISRCRFMQADEVPRFFISLAEEPPLIRDFMLLCLLTGARKSRVAEMRWEQISFDGATWRIPSELEKNGRQHTVPLVPKALEILKERKRTSSSEWVFPTKSKTGHLVSPKNAWLRVKKRAGLDDLRQAETGADLAIIGKTLNHKDISTTLIYARLTLDPVRHATEVATTALLNAGAVTTEEEDDDESIEEAPPPPVSLIKRRRRTAGA